MIRSLRRVSALGLAACTVVAGLALGPAASAQPAAPHVDSPSTGPSTPPVPTPEATGVVTLVFQRDATTFHTPTFSYKNGVVTGYTTHRSESAAEAAATPLEVLPSGGGWFQLRDPVTTSCASSVAAARFAALMVVYEKTCDGDPARRFRVMGDRLESAAHPGQSITGPTSFHEDSGNYLWNILGFGTGTPLPVVGDVDALRSFSATIASVDLPRRSATLTGTAVPGSYVVVGGSHEERVEADGSWRTEVTGLALGSNPVTLEQYENQVKTAEASVDVVLEVRPLRGDVTFPADRTQEARVGGTAHPGAEVVVSTTDGAELARVPASAGVGTWSTPLSAPNAPGDRELTVRQFVDGDPAGEIAVVAGYGAGVTITAPVEGMAHDGGPVAMNGSGEPGAAVSIREQGRPTVLGTATVLQNGRWSSRTTNVDSATHVLEARHEGRGANRTTALVTLNPEGVTPPVVGPPTVESPQNGETVTTSRPRFTGHGHEGATITIGFGPNSIIGSGVVRDGAWTIDPDRGLALGRNALIVTQKLGDDVQTLTHVVDRVAVELPFRVTSHADGGLYDTGLTTFRGTAPIGATIVAKNQWNTLMGTDYSSDGTWAFDRNLGPTSAGYDLTFTATVPGGTPRVTRLKLNYGGTLAFQVTSPLHNSTYAEGVATFTGRAAPNTSVVATNQWGTRMGQATSNLSGAWSFDRYLGPTATGYDITFVATRGDDVQRSILHLNPRTPDVPVRVTSHVDGEVFRPGPNTLTGVGAPLATVSATARVAGSDVDLGSAPVATDGRWTLPARSWGAGDDHVVTVKQTSPGGAVSETTLRLVAPVFAPLVLTSPQVGDTYENGVPTRFSGTATPFAEVTVRSAMSDTVYQTVEADARGAWSFSRSWGPSHDYVLVIDQQAKDGQGSRLPDFAWNSSAR